MMTTLTQKPLHFNRSIKLSNDGGALSSDTGELIFREFDEKIGFSQTIAKHLCLKDTRTYCIHENEQLLRQKIYQLIAGYHEDDAARIWKEHDCQAGLEKDGYVTLAVWRDESGQRKIGRGRPKKSECEKLKHSIHVRLDEEPYQKLSQFCTEQNIDISEAIRLLIRRM